MSWLSACPVCRDLQPVTGGRTAGDFWEAELVVSCAVCKTELKRVLVQEAAKEIRGLSASGAGQFEAPMWRKFLDAGLIERERCVYVEPDRSEPEPYKQPARITKYHNARQRDYAARRSAKGVPCTGLQPATESR